MRRKPVKKAAPKKTAAATPDKKPAASVAPAARAGDAPKPAASASSRIIILIIDDDPFISGMYATRLINDGFTVISAMDGFDGLKKAAAERPNIILLDVLMPKMDGFETLKRLKDDPVLSAIPVLMLTSMGQKEDIDRGMQGGAIDYMVKTHTLPVDASVKIKSVLKNRK